MSTPIRAAGLAAVLIVAAVAGIYLLPIGGTGGRGGVGPTPSPTASPLPTPSPIALTAADVDRRLAAGTYRFADPFAVPFSVTFGPGGWRPYGIASGEVHFGIDDSDLPEPYVAVEVVDGVYRDPCHTEPGPISSPKPLTVDGTVALMTDIVGFETGPVTETEIDGRPAKTFTMTNAVDTATAGCSGGEMLPILQSVGALDVATNGHTSQTWWVFDVDGRTVVIAGEGLITSQDPDIETVTTLLESITFD